MVRESCWRSIVWVNTVCVWRWADTSRAGERERVCVCVCVEMGRHKQSWRDRELRLCSHCTDGLIEDELHFLTECSKYKHIRDAYFKQIALVSPEFQQTSNTEKLSYILGEKEKCIHLAAQYVHSCHQMRDNGWTLLTIYTSSLFSFNVLVFIFVINWDMSFIFPLFY